MSNPTHPRTPAEDASYAKRRYGNPELARKVFYPADDRARVLDARLSHVQWVAARVLEGANDLLTHAQLREEELIENLVKAKNTCDETAAPAEAVLAAARLVEELEQHIENLSVIVADTDALAAGDDDA